MSESGKDFDVRLATDADVDGVLAALSDGYGRPFTRDWFDWKHRDSPWGASRCYIAEDADGLLGASFEMPWRFSEGGEPVTGWRLVDGATTVRAQRRGVFRTMVMALLQDCAASTEKGVALATATPEARLAHIKNGAAALDPIRAYYRPVRWSTGSVTTAESVLDSWVAPAAGAMSTVWDSAALRWRLDPRSGVDYQVSRLANSEAAHGAIHRVVAGKVRTLVVTATWGEPGEVNRLLRALARQAKAPVVLSNFGDGATARKPRIAWARGQSLMCVWDQRSTAPTQTHDRVGWALDGLDLEGVI